VRRTKIVCTIGPASEEYGTVLDLIRAGMDVARLNFSHGEHKEHAARVETIRRASEEQGKRVGILVDTRGPEVRIKTFLQGEVMLREGDIFTLTTEDVEGDEEKVSVTYADFPVDVKSGARILLDDGMIELKAEEISGSSVKTRVIHGGRLSSRKSINLPGVSINLPSISKEDKQDIDFAIEQGVDFIAASFIRRADDVLAIRELLEQSNSDIRIIAKIENCEGVENFAEILDVTDGIMIARGDLGVEIPAEDVPLVQKRLIQSCNQAGKPVITATQMLDSMIRQPRPTRAEASDVANAIFDGTDAVMLSGETAAGAYPLEAVQTMARIAERTEIALDHKKAFAPLETPAQKTVTDSISSATCRAAHELGAVAIISATHSGHTARMVSKYKPKAPIIAVTPRERIATALTLTWGVYPLLSPPTFHTDEVFNTAVSIALDAGLIKNGDLVILTAGVPVGVPGTTNFMRIDTVGEVLVQGLGVGKTAVTGEVHVARTPADAVEIKEGQILVAPYTDKDYLPAMEKSSAIITEAGGLTSHAAIVGLNLGIPVIVGASGATSELSTGQLITVETVRGLVYRGRATVL